MIEFEYIPLKGDYFHNNSDNNYIILEYRLKVYSGQWLFDNGLILNDKFDFYSQNLNAGEFLKYQNINIKLKSKEGFAILIVKKQLNERAQLPRDTGIR